jgi:NADPH:quinone reductase-like Zn-dependent oxidoreductase
MKAVVIVPASSGSALASAVRLEASVPRPSPRKADQALIKVTSSSVNPVDVYVARGDFGGKPVGKIVGGDVAGVVVEAPSSSASASSSLPSFKPGDRVWALTPYYFPSAEDKDKRDGCWAEFCAADAAWLAPAPPEDRLPLADAGAGPLVLLTAWQALCAALGPPLPEEEEEKEGASISNRPRVLVTAAAGGVGHSAVQLAKQAWGATVVAVAGAPNRDFLLQDLGADEFVDYRDEQAVRRALGEEGEGDARGSGRGLDAAIDLLGGEWTARLAAALGRSSGKSSSGSRLAHIMNRGSDRSVLNALAADKGMVAPAIILVKPDGAALARMSRMIARGELRVHVSARYPLERAGEALEAVSGWHTRGKVVVTV